MKTNKEGLKLSTTKSINLIHWVKPVAAADQPIRTMPVGAASSATTGKSHKDKRTVQIVSQIVD